MFAAQFPKLAPQDWIAVAERTWREHAGALLPDYDAGLARTLQRADLESPAATLWNEFDALARVPLMIIRGANSEMLTSTTLNAMLARRGEADIVVVPDQGHAPLLTEPKLIRRIAAFIHRARSTSHNAGLSGRQTVLGVPGFAPPLQERIEAEFGCGGYSSTTCERASPFNRRPENLVVQHDASRLALHNEKT